MSGASPYDVVVCGASLAGSATATLLARAGARVALVERSPDPDAFKRACTHIVQSSANGVIERLGLAEPLERAGAVRALFAMSTPWGRIVPPLRDGEPRYGLNTTITRSRLDPTVRRVAAETPGVELLGGRTVVGLVEDGGRAAGAVVRDAGGRDEAIRARLVVGADGRDSAVAAAAGLPLRSRPNERFAYWAYYRDAELVPPGAGFWLLGPDMDLAYAFPTDDGLTLAAAFCSRGRLAEFRQDPGAALERFFAAIEDAPDLRAARREGEVLGRLEMPNLSRPPAAAGVALVGDAAVAADPAAGVGCGWALQSAAWLADCVGGAAIGDAPLDPALREYESRHRSELASHARVIAEGSLARTPSGGERALYRAASRDPVLAERLHGYATRNVSPKVLSAPATLARVARASLRR